MKPGIAAVSMCPFPEPLAKGFLEQQSTARTLTVPTLKRRHSGTPRSWSALVRADRL